VEVPVPAVVASPAVLIVATVVVNELQVTELVRFWVLVSLNVSVAVNGIVVPACADLTRQPAGTEQARTAQFQAAQFHL